MSKHAGNDAQPRSARAMHATGQTSAAGGVRVHGLPWRLWYVGWKPGAVTPNPGEPVFVSVTDFHIHHPWHAPGAWRTGLRLRRSWPRLEGAIGLWLWSEPTRMRSGSISIWQTEEELMRFLRSPTHLTIMREYGSRMSGTSHGRTAPRFDRAAIWKHAVTELRTGRRHR
jgi:hypothetical protein